MGTSAINAPVLGNFFAGPPTVTGVTVTVSGVGSEENGNYCVTRVEETTHYSNGYTQTRTIYTDVCTDSPGPDMKGSMAGRSSQDCPGGGDGALVLVPYELVAIQDKLCLPEEGQAYAFLMENGAERHQLYTYLEDQNVPDDCTDDSPARLFALEAAMAMAEGAEVDFENGIIFSSSVPDCAKNIIKDLIADKTFLDLGDMPDIIKQELNLSGFILDLFNHSDKYKLVFKSESLTQTTPSGTTYKNASTNPKMDISNPGKFIFTITLDSSFIENATDLAIARTIIHETVHSYISYQYQEDVFSSFSQAYAKLLGSVNNNPNSAQHRLMATDFVHAISNSLANWDNYSIGNSGYYGYMSWSGEMLATPTFTNKSSTFQQAVINANQAEGNAGPNGNYSPSTSKGTKNCN